MQRELVKDKGITLKFNFCFIANIQVDKQLEYQLFKLYHNENDIKRLTDELGGKNEELRKSVDKREGVEERIRGKKKELGQLTRELAAIEKDTREKVRFINDDKQKFTRFWWMIHFKN